MAPPALVLAYHGLGEVPRRLDPHGLMVPEASFRHHVRTLRRRGYEFVTQAEFARRLRVGGEPPAGTAALTFDDGPEDNATLLPRLLEELDVRATLFVNPGLLGSPYRWLGADTGIRVMTETQLLEVSRHPLVEIGSHTSKHRLLGDADEELAFAELSGSKRELEEMLGLEVVSFAYPACQYSPACPAAAERAGYTSAVTCANRGGWTPYELRRESPAPGDGRLVFELKSRGHFHRVRSLPPVRVARWATRRIRYGTS
jgi:peptidoglycan/xylan/chitin deacetylase (PgdA/CDA1 family)